jgi:uncharacterized protein (TIGR03435 family)
VYKPQQSSTQIISQCLLQFWFPRKLALPTAALLFLFSAITAQQIPQSAAFEVADIHASAPGKRSGMGTLPNGRFEAHAYTLLGLIRYAYGISDEKIMGGPTWLNIDRFDIIAKIPTGSRPNTIPASVKTLLSDRFHLTVHEEEQKMPAYALVLSNRRTPLKEDGGTDELPCKSELKDGSVTYTCPHLSIQRLAERLPSLDESYFDRPAVDRTGLKGAYSFTLRWIPRLSIAPGNGSSGNGNGSLFDELERQLGVRVEPVEVPSSVLVIDSVDRAPTPNDPEIVNLLPPPLTEFEVATIHPSRPEATEHNYRVNGSQMEIHGYTLRQLVALAYQTDGNMALGGEKWVDTQRFDVIAKAPLSIPWESRWSMLRTLLADRFRLDVQREVRPVDAYVLTLAKDAAKLQRSDGLRRSGCKAGSTNGFRNYTCLNLTMEQFANELRDAAPMYINHPVVEQTGLAGAYKFSLSWVIVPTMQARTAKASESMEGASPASDPSGGITVFQALERQLGLKLTAQKQPMAVMVIRKASPPTDN